MESFSRVVVLALGAALVVALIRDGPGGPTRWVKAKLLGDDGTPSADQTDAAAITAGGVNVTAQDIANAPPLQPNPPGATGSAVTAPRATTTPRSSQRLVCPAGMRLVGSVCVGSPAGRVNPGPGRPVGTF